MSSEKYASTHTIFGLGLSTDVPISGFDVCHLFPSRINTYILSQYRLARWRWQGRFHYLPFWSLDESSVVYSVLHQLEQVVRSCWRLSAAWSSSLADRLLEWCDCCKSRSCSNNHCYQFILRTPSRMREEVSRGNAFLIEVSFVSGSGVVDCCSRCYRCGFCCDRCSSCSRCSEAKENDLCRSH